MVVSKREKLENSIKAKTKFIKMRTSQIAKETAKERPNMEQIGQWHAERDSTRKRKRSMQAKLRYLEKKK